jgi:acyl-ACP thioesterase
MDMKKHINTFLYISMLYSKIKAEIDINNDELLETIWEHMKEIKRGGNWIIELITYNPFTFILTSSSHFQITT